MEKINKGLFKQLYLPPKQSHKSQNGKLTIIGGSKLFHGASFWALKTASRIVDMVFYATVEENKQLIKDLKSQLYDFILIPRGKTAYYLDQSDAVLIGPGLVRGGRQATGTGESGRQTKKLTKKVLTDFPDKKWIIDAGSLQVMEKEWLAKLDQVVITPHLKEFVVLFDLDFAKIKGLKFEELAGLVKSQAEKYNCLIVLKGVKDLVCSAERCFFNTTGNQGMTKGGSGDVLAGLIAGLSCKNDLFLAARAGVYLNGLAGDQLYKSRGPFYNASDLCDQLPKTLWKLLK